MSAYADSTYYTDVYCGSMSAEDYNRYSQRATDYIAAVSRSNIDLATAADTLKSAVKNACCALSEVFYKYANGGGVASESNDGISVTYQSRFAKVSSTPENELATVIRHYLGHTGLLYSGI